MNSLLSEPSTDTFALQPVSHNQKRMWYAHQLVGETGEYNIAFSARVFSPVDVVALRRATETLIMRHPILRTTYSLTDGKLLQQVHETSATSFETIDASAWHEDELKRQCSEAIRRPFDLALDTPLRICLFTLEPNHHILLFIMPHIAVDTVAIGYLLEELRTLYRAEATKKTVPPATSRPPYLDFVRWQSAMLISKKGEQLRTYWHEQLGGRLPLLNLPIDRPYPSVQTYYGGAHSFPLEAELIDKLHEVVGKEASLYAIFLSAFQILLWHYSGQEDILVGSPVTNRTRSEFAQSIGDFSDVVVMRGDLSGNPTFEKFLMQVSKTVRAGLFYADYPVDRLLEELTYERDPRRPPLYQVLFNMPQANSAILHEFAPFLIPYKGKAEVDFGGLMLEPFYLHVLEAPVELSLDIWQPDGFYGVLKYNADLFHAQTIATMAEHFQTLLAAIAADPSQRIADLPLANNPDDMLHWVLPYKRTIWVEEHTLYPDAIETALLAHDQIVDCWVTVNQTVANQKRLDAFIVLSQSPSLTALQAHLQRVDQHYPVPIHVLAVNALPLTPTGRVDERTLATLLEAS